MADTPFFAADLDALIPPIPEAGIVSRSIFSGEALAATVFGFAPGQELSEHTAARPAVLHFLRGRARVTIEGQGHDAGPGSWIYLPARLPHSVRAIDEATMLLLLA